MTTGLSNKLNDIIKEYRDFKNLYLVSKKEDSPNPVFMLRYSRHLVVLRNQFLAFVKANPKELTAFQKEAEEEIFEGIAPPSVVRKEKTKKIMEADHSVADAEVKKNTKTSSSLTAGSTASSRQASGSTSKTNVSKDGKRKLKRNKFGDLVDEDGNIHTTYTKVLI